MIDGDVIPDHDGEYPGVGVSIFEVCKLLR